MEPKFCIIIPVFNHSETVGEVVKKCQTSSSHFILIIDDGSSLPVSKLIPISHRIKIIRNKKNEGKGFSLQRGFSWAIENGFTHAITIDADCQHDPSDIPLLTEQAKIFCWDLILGFRQFVTDSVPTSSKFGRSFSNFWVYFETGKKIKDSQSGFRVYPLFLLQTMVFNTKKYDFEIEVLVQFLWKGGQVQEVPISVFYAELGKRISHFKKWQDNLRLSWLHTQLVTISLLRWDGRLKRFAVVLGVGFVLGGISGILLFCALWSLVLKNEKKRNKKNLDWEKSRGKMGELVSSKSSREERRESSAIFFVWDYSLFLFFCFKRKKSSP